METLRPRLSRRVPMEAAATPLPREDTTPPVTKMYFGAVRKVACESPECLRTSNYAFARSVCQIANRDARNLFFTPGRFLRHLLLRRQTLLHPFDIGGHIHRDRVVIRFHYANLESVLQPTQLLKLLHALQFPRRQRRKFQQRLATVPVQPDVLRVPRRH